MGFPRQEYRSGLAFPPLGELPDPGIEPMSPAVAGEFLTTEPPGKPCVHMHPTKITFVTVRLLVYLSVSRNRIPFSLVIEIVFESLSFSDQSRCDLPTHSAQVYSNAT